MTREAPYTLDILRLAASLPVQTCLAHPDGVAEARSRSCGSRIRVEVAQSEGRITDLAQSVTACAYGQASAAIVQDWAPGRLKAEVIVMRAALKAWLEGRTAAPVEFGALEPVRSRAGRHGAVLLPFDALLAALDAAT